MKKFMKMLASFAALATIFAFSSCSNDDDSDYDDNLKLVTWAQMAKNKASQEEDDEDKKEYTFEFTKSSDEETYLNSPFTWTGFPYNNQVWSGVYLYTNEEGVKMAFCIAPTSLTAVYYNWKLYKELSDSGYTQYSEYASGDISDEAIYLYLGDDYTQSHKVKNGTWKITVTYYNSEAFDSEITKGTAVISGTQCTLTLK